MGIISESERRNPMIRVEMNTVVARPIEDIFGRLTDLSDYSRWMPKLGIFVRCGQTSEGPVGEGTTYYDRGRMGTFRGEIVEFRPQQGSPSGSLSDGWESK